MKIITEIEGASENRIVYLHNGTVGVLRRPSICPLAEMRRELRASFDRPKPVPAAAAEKKNTPKPVSETGGGAESGAARRTKEAAAKPSKEKNGKNDHV